MAHRRPAVVAAAVAADVQHYTPLPSKFVIHYEKGKIEMKFTIFMGFRHIVYAKAYLIKD